MRKMSVNRLSFPERCRHFFFKVRICILCRREGFTTYSDGKHLKLTNNHLRPGAVIMNMQNRIRPNNKYVTNFNENNLYTLFSENVLSLLCSYGAHVKYWTTAPHFSNIIPFFTVFNHFQSSNSFLKVIQVRH